jgi:undecaprenyl pyrophosphate synthase
VYGDVHEKYALAHINLAQAYLEMKGLPVQAKKHAEIAWNILIENLRAHAKLNVQREQQEASKATAITLAKAKEEAAKKEAAENENFVVIGGIKTHVEDEKEVEKEKAGDKENAVEVTGVVEETGVAPGRVETRQVYSYPDSDKHQMMLNYIYGRACTILRE